jgi:hypothetical protein
MSEPLDESSTASTARPTSSQVDGPYGRGSADPTSDPVSTDGGLYRTPLLSRTVFAVLLMVGVVVGIAGPILLWLNVTYVIKETPFYMRIGYVLVLVGLGILIIALPLALGEAARLERGPLAVGSGGTGEGRASGRWVTGTRVFALIGMVILLAGVFLLRPVEPTETSTSGGSSQGGGGGRG